MEKAFLTIANMVKPVIVAAHGVAAANGAGLVAMADLAIIAEGTKIGTTAINVGLFCMGPAVPLSRSLGRKLCLEMLLTGEPIDARQALQFGLINRVVSLQSVMDESLRMAEKLCRRGPVAMRTIKESVLRGLALEQGLHFEAFLFDSLQTSEDSREGVRAFAERRRPVFKGK